MTKNDKKTNEEIESLKVQIQALDDKYKRALADYQNLQKRTEEDKYKFARLAGVSIISSQLNVLDNLEKAAEHLGDNGLNMILSQFKGSISDAGAEEFNPMGQTFDPDTMECVETKVGDKDIVLEVTQKGYKLGEYIIRPAKVVVGKNDQ